MGEAPRVWGADKEDLKVMPQLPICSVCNVLGNYSGLINVSSISISALQKCQSAEIRINESGLRSF